MKFSSVITWLSKQLSAYSVLFGLGLLLDRWTKAWALSNAPDMRICSILNFSLVRNSGICWGLGHNADCAWSTFVIIIMVVNLIIIAGFSYYTFYEQLYRRKACIFLEMLVLTGAVSNIIDRCMYVGSVVDFIQFHLGEWYFPTFNIADIFIVCGVIGLFIKHMVSAHED